MSDPRLCPYDFGDPASGAVDGTGEGRPEEFALDTHFFDECSAEGQGSGLCHGLDDTTVTVLSKVCIASLGGNAGRGTGRWRKRGFAAEDKND